MGEFFDSIKSKNNKIIDESKTLKIYLQMV